MAIAFITALSLPSSATATDIGEINATMRSEAGKIIPLSPAINPSALPSLPHHQDCFERFISEQAYTREEGIGKARKLVKCASPTIKKTTESIQGAVKKVSGELIQLERVDATSEGLIAKFRVKIPSN